MTNISHEDLIKLRKELENQFFQLAHDELSALGVRPRERNSLARKVIAAAEKKSGNKSRELLKQCFEQEVALEQKSLRRIKQENEAVCAKTSAELQSVRQELEAEYLRLLNRQLDLLGIPLPEQKQMARQMVAEAEKVATVPTRETLKNAFHWRMQEELKALDYALKKYGLADPSNREKKYQVAYKYLQEGDELKEQGNYKQSEFAYNQSRIKFTEIGHRHGEAAAYMGLAHVSYKLGDFTLAKIRYELALVFFKDTKLEEFTGQIFDRLGSMAYQQGALDVARENWGHALTRYTNAGKRDGERAQKLIRILNRIK